MPPRPGTSTLLIFLVGLGSHAVAGEEAPSFNRDVRPILSEHCFTCHGPDAGSRKADLRLDRRDAATATLETGATAIVPGDPDGSELLARILADDPGEKMPPASTGRRTSPAQVETLRRWIRAGAPWEEHWSLAPPRRSKPPAVRSGGWARNPVDLFLLAEMEGRGISPSPEADRITLARRLRHDLTGLPVSPAEANAFAADPRADAYERLVDRLLASPRFGERMAVAWLDLVRFADTVGYHSDVNRSISLYRDYVIRSFNDDLPFDRFTVEQLAGDLLPDPTDWQRVASAYNMLGLTTEEGGAQPREYLAKYAADRVRNLGSVWMGATLACAECHDHKYDPYPTRDFYALEAFFADLQQPGVGTPKPGLALPTERQAARRRALIGRIEELRRRGTKDDLKEAEAELARLDRSIRSTIVSTSGPPRVTRVLRRGDWMDDGGEVVEPSYPAAVRVPGAMAPAGGRATRIDLARWLTSPAHPQTARVAVNRLWKLAFGEGLAASLEDLGSQGEWPTHPALLDWLAVEFRECGWSVKHIVRTLVTSSAYRQSSRPRDDLATVDPSNRLFARQAAYRREAEFIRDQALAVSGLLVPTLGGESIRPYQPEGYWRFLNFPKREYAPSPAPDQHRRGLYIHWQRTLLHPALLALDAPSRETCAARRPVSNTPQAALALLNEPGQVEAARALASRVLAEGGPDDPARAAWLWREVLTREGTEEERSVLLDLLARHRAGFAADPTSALALLAVGMAPADGRHLPAELAAWTSVARVVLNLDEALTRE